MSSIRRLILNDPDVCVRVRLVTIRDEVPKVLDFLQSVGVLHVSEPSIVGQPEVEFVENLSHILAKASTVLAEYLRRLGKELVVKLDDIPRIDEVPEMLNKLLSGLEEDLERIKALESKILEARSRIEELEEVRKFLRLIVTRVGDIDSSMVFYEGSYLKIYPLYGAIDSVEAFLKDVDNLVLERIIDVTIDDRRYVVISFRAQDLELIRNKAHEHRLRIITISYRGRVSEVIEKVSKDIEHHLSLLTLEEDIRKLVEKHVKDLALLKLIVDSYGDRVQVLRLAIRSQYAEAIEGWIPSSRYAEFIEAVESNLKYTLIERVEVREEPPVDLRNPKVLKDFELVTRLYGLPSPNEWDPTPIFTYSFVLFFALMLADMGYAIGLAIATRYVLPLFVDNPESEDFKRLQRILYVSAIASAVVGVLGNSFFGYPLLPLTILPQLTNMLELMKLSLIIGYVHVLIAHVIAAAKNARFRNVYGVVNELGIALVMIFGLPVALELTKTYILPPNVIDMVCKPITIAAVVMIIVSKLKQLGGVGAILWIFDITGIVGDVLSYMRIAGIAMATLLMAKVFNELAQGIVSFFSSSIGGLLGVIVGIPVGIVFLIVVHIFNLAISSISPFVHSLRLCLLEFGSKFFEGGGREYRPFRARMYRYVSLRM